jgi:hypothetical protein
MDPENSRSGSGNSGEGIWSDRATSCLDESEITGIDVISITEIGATRKDRKTLFAKNTKQ